MNYDEIIKSVTKPSRYAGCEFNIQKKNWTDDIIKIALVFPDVYEIGLSGLGLKIIYEIINSRTDALSERFYSPWLDMQEKLIENSLYPLSCENKRPLSDFDMIGFSLQYELTYTNVLNILRLSGIELFSKFRKKKIVFAGGPCTYNPEPVADFFDFFVIGEGEEVIGEIIEIFKLFRNEKKDKILKEISKINGIYMPSLYNVSYDEDYKIKSIIAENAENQTVNKRVVNDLNNSVFPLKPILPYIETVHDRLVFELNRGCTRGCRFCQAGMIYRPVREKKADTLIRQIVESVKNTGYSELSLSSLSCSDYINILSLLNEIYKKYEDRMIVSLPSLRSDTFTEEFAEILGKFKKSTITFAVEAGSSRLRKYINKGLEEENLISSLLTARKYGWFKAKLYFMIGLPSEQTDDIEDIVILIRNLIKRTGFFFTVSFSIFIPKSNTPFQWEVQDCKESLLRKIDFLKKRLNHPKIKLSFHDVETSILEAIMSKGDRRLSKVIYQAFLDGAVFDSWREKFDFMKWKEAFKKCGIDYMKYIERIYSYDDILPWDHISAGVSKKYLENENRDAKELKYQYDCRSEKCSACMVCKELGVNIVKEKSIRILEKGNYINRKDDNKNINLNKIRLKYQKNEPLTFLSHLETLRVFEKAVKRAEISINYTSGFHPRMKMVFAYPLGVNIESESEYLDIELNEKYNENDLMISLNSHLPDGLKIINARYVSKSFAKIAVLLTSADYEVILKNSSDIKKIKSNIEKCFEENKLIIIRKEKEENVINYIENFEINEKSVKIKIKINGSRSVKPFLILNGLGISDNDIKILKRTALFVKVGDCNKDPIDIE